MAADAPTTGSALTASSYKGRMPTRPGDMTVETHGIAPAASPVAATTAIPATGDADGRAIAPDAFCFIFSLEVSNYT